MSSWLGFKRCVGSAVKALKVGSEWGRKDAGKRFEAYLRLCDSVAVRRVFKVRVSVRAAASEQQLVSVRPITVIIARLGKGSRAHIYY